MFNRRGGYGGRSKATPTTTCQKCLQKGHYSYECKVSAQDRPYKPRPSRTQQLLNPNLKPKLSEDVPSDLGLTRKKGLADKILAEKEEERRKKSEMRSRSLSSPSDSDSVSTISTNRSRSRSRSPKQIENGRSYLHGGDALGKRDRRSVSSESDYMQDRVERNTRRRLSSMSPGQRGRRRSRSRSSRMEGMSPDERERPNPSRPRRNRSHSRGRGGRRSRSTMSPDQRGNSRSRSRSSRIAGMSIDAHERDRSHSRGRDGRDAYRKHPGRRLSPSRSPSRSPNRMDTSDDREPHQNERSHKSSGMRGHHAHTSRSRSRSPYRRRSPSPYPKRRLSRSPSPYKDRNGGMNGHGPRGGRNRFDTEPVRAAPLQPPPARERSLSPYSKRVAMTRQMQGGR